MRIVLEEPLPAVDPLRRAIRWTESAMVAALYRGGGFYRPTPWQYLEILVHNSTGLVQEGMRTRSGRCKAPRQGPSPQCLEDFARLVHRCCLGQVWYWDGDPNKVALTLALAVAQMLNLEDGATDAIWKAARKMMCGGENDDKKKEPSREDAAASIGKVMDAVSSEISKGKRSVILPAFASINY